MMFINPDVANDREDDVLKKFVNEAGLGLKSRKREAAATNFFHPICLSFYHLFMQLEGKLDNLNYSGIVTNRYVARPPNRKGIAHAAATGGMIPA